MDPERVEEVHAAGGLREGRELVEIGAVRGVVGARRSGHHEPGRPAPAAQRHGRGDRGLDPLAPREASRQDEERVRAREVEAFRQTRALRGKAERGGDVDAVGDDGDRAAGEPRERGELPRALVGHRDVPDARVRAGKEVPGLA